MPGSGRPASVEGRKAALAGTPRAPRGTVKSADRVLTLFEFLGRWDRELSHTEIAEMLKIPKSSLTQLMRNLVARGWLSYSPATKGYSLGDAIARLARGAMLQTNLVDLARPILIETTEITNETTELHVLRGGSIEVKASYVSPTNLMALMRTGDIAPLYAIAGGKAMLAALPNDMREEYFANVQIEPLAAKTVRSVEELRTHIEAAQREGVAYSFEEYSIGIVGTGKAIIGLDGNVLGAFDTPTPAVRYDNAARRKIANALEQAAAKMRRQLEFANAGSAPAQPPAGIPAPARPRTADALPGAGKKAG